MASKVAAMDSFINENQLIFVVFDKTQFGPILLDDRFSVKKINFFRNLKKLKIDESTKLIDKLKNRTINYFGRQTRSMGQKTN
jgi:hypothetical protein